MRSGFRLCLVLALWGLILPGLAWAQPWTAVGSSGNVAPSTTSLPIHSLAGPFLGYAVVSTDPISAYYNVTAVAGTNPPWTTLEMNVAIAGGTGAQVDAGLYRSARCGTFMPELICKVGTSATGCFKCSFQPTLDFDNYEYYVLVTLQRSSTSAGFPNLRSLRIY